MGLYTVVWGKSKDPIASTAPLKDDKNLELPVSNTTKTIAIVTTTNTTTTTTATNP